MCWMVERSRVVTEGKNKGQVVWSIDGYHGNWAGALRRFVDKELRCCGAKTFTELKECFKRLEVLLAKIGKELSV